MAVFAQIVQPKLGTQFSPPRTYILSCLICEMVASYLFLHRYVYELMIAQSLKEVLVY